MTITADRPALPPDRPEDDVPRVIDPGIAGTDRRFKRIATANGVAVLILTGSIGVLLGVNSIPAVRHYGSKFFTSSGFQPNDNVFGIASAVLGTIEVAIIALIIAFPLALASALFITEYAPRWLRGTLVFLTDLMAAVPSLIFGAWGVKALMPHALFVDRWLAQWLGWIPFFKVPGVSAKAVPLDTSTFVQTPFIAGVVVSLMVIPLASSVMRGVFAQAPISEREAAFALGATRWGMIRTVVLPFGRGGIVGGTMLGLGRALGETVAVLLILSPIYQPSIRVLRSGGVTISSLIANNFGEAPAGAQRDGLLAAGFVLFLMTLVVNTIAAMIVNRGRSGAGLDA